MNTTTNSKVFGDMRIGQSFQYDIGGGNWTATVVKVSQDEVRRADGRVLGVSFWTKVREVQPTSK